MKKWFLIFFVSLPVFAEEGPMIYLEKRGEEKVAMPAWAMAGPAALQEAIPFPLENFPTLTLQRIFTPKEKISILGELLEKYSEHLVLKAKEEIIPLNGEETLLNQKLKAYGVQEALLEGEGECLIDPKTKSVVAEQFVLSGQIVKNSDPKHWQIEWARATEVKP